MPNETCVQLLPHCYLVDLYRAVFGTQLYGEVVSVKRSKSIADELLGTRLYRVVVSVQRSNSSRGAFGTPPSGL